MRAAPGPILKAVLAVLIGAGAAAAPAQSANAWADGGFGGVQGWGGLYRPDRDVGWGPEYILYGYAYGAEPAVVQVLPRHAHPRQAHYVHRRRHAVVVHCALTRPVPPRCERC